MLNNGLKQKAIKRLKSAVDFYDEIVEKVKQGSEELHSLRNNSAIYVIKPVESYINSLANSPKEFDKAFSEYKAEFKVFNDVAEEFSRQSLNSSLKSGIGATAGIAAGVGTAALMPAAAMAVATTFGTASTGMAISTLSGAAATKAALAWLGGGAIVAGGGGMAGGTALLALAGPIGIGIGAIGIIGGGLFAFSKNKSIAIKANDQCEEIESLNRVLSAAYLEIQNLIKLTEEHQQGTLSILEMLYLNAPKDYKHFSNEDKDQLSALINHIEVLSKLIIKKIE